VAPGRPDRYEPLPGLLDLPRFLIGKLGPRGRRRAAVAAVLLGIAAVAGLAIGIPAIVAAKHRTAVADAREAARERAARIAQLTKEQRPIAGTGAAGHGLAGAAAVAAHDRLKAVLVRDIGADAQRRVRTGEFSVRPHRVDCRRSPVVPGAPDPASVPGTADATYSCLAVTADISRSSFSSSGSIGYPYSALVHFRTGRFAFCRISGRPGEMLIGRDIAVAVPTACGGVR
jgi:hypothetical protein